MILDEHPTPVAVDAFRTPTRAVRRFENDAPEVFRTAARAGGGPDFATLLEFYRADQKVVTDHLLEDPDAYVNPYRYLTATRDRLPPPLLSIELGENFILQQDALPSHPAIRFPRKSERAWNRMVMDPHRPPRQELLDAALDLEFKCSLSDVMFSDEPLGKVERAFILGALDQAFGLKPLNIF